MTNVEARMSNECPECPNDEKSASGGTESLINDFNQSQEINNQTSRLDKPQERSAAWQAVQAILADKGIGEATITIAVVDDPAIHDLNRRFLNHDEPTDVLSFLLDDKKGIEGDVVVSIDTAQRAAERFGWSTGDELLLYTIHGALHLVGYDDRDPESRAEMRERERHYLSPFGLRPRYDESALKPARPRRMGLERLVRNRGTGVRGGFVRGHRRPQPPRRFLAQQDGRAEPAGADPSAL